MSVDPKLPLIIQYIREEFSPVSIYLFGSRAKGTATAQSDYDFVVVTAEKSWEKWQAFDKARREIFVKFNCLADVWIYSTAEFNDLTQEFGSMPETAVSTGIEV